MNFKLKKTVAFLIMAILPILSGFLAISFLGDDILMLGLGILAGVGLSFLVGMLLITHPLMQVIEGQGLGILGIDSSGLFKFYLAKIVLPSIKYKNAAKENVETNFDRKLSVTMDTNIHKAEIIEDGEDLHITLKKNQFASHKFGYGGLTFLLCNEKTGTFISKEFLCSAEDQLVADHAIFYIARKVDDLSNNFRDFGRYIVEQLRKQGTGLFGGMNILIILLIVCVIGVAIIFGPQLMEMVGRMGAGAAQAVPQNVPVRPLQ